MIRISDLIDIYNYTYSQNHNVFDVLRYVYSKLGIADDYCYLSGSGEIRYDLPEINGVFGYFEFGFNPDERTYLKSVIWDRNNPNGYVSFYFEMGFQTYNGYEEHHQIFSTGNEPVNVLDSYVDRNLDLVINSLVISNKKSFKKGYPIKKKLQYLDIDNVEHSEIDVYSCFAQSLVFSINGLKNDKLWTVGALPRIYYAINISFEGSSPVTSSQHYLTIYCGDTGLFVVTQSDVQTDECFYEDSLDLDDLNNYYFPAYQVPLCNLDIDCEDCFQYEYLMKSLMRSINYLSQLITKNKSEGDEMDYTPQLTAINNSLQAIHSDLQTTVEVEEGQTAQINITQAVVNVSEEKDPLPIVISEGVTGLKAIPFDKINNL